MKFNSPGAQWMESEMVSPTLSARISWSPPILSCGLTHSTWLINPHSPGPVVYFPMVNYLP